MGSSRATLFSTNPAPVKLAKNMTYASVAPKNHETAEKEAMLRKRFLLSFWRRLPLQSKPKNRTSNPFIPDIPLTSPEAMTSWPLVAISISHLPPLRCATLFETMVHFSSSESPSCSWCSSEDAQGREGL
ncbi:hypothetical protein JTE90_020069 [Oedothorax gibbosus]|uniref:Uncharacterized protein n=1 Tax=Oedothorax gibbosus TaxID=931172 RepID=A0AAV6URV4_9ARAC|nr:hypothetical protein JTE90_020069 [Oedothorax gibbosus]